jgi:hypothetical protein
MEKSIRSKGFSNIVKYGIPVLIAVVVGLYLLFISLPGPEKKIEKEAEKRIEALKGELREPVDLERADHFVDAKTVLSKKERQIITTTPKTLLEDLSIGPKAEIKILVEEEKTRITTPRALMENRTIPPDARIRILREDGVIMETTPRELMADSSITPDTPIKVIEKVEKVVVTTPEELQKTAPSPETPIKVVLEKPGEPITLSQLFPGKKGLQKDTFYIHAVTMGDVQGIWGIIQRGLMDQFLKGIPIPGGEEISREQVLQLKIPEDADEPRRDGYSSFLGRFLDSKTRESYVYNYTSGRMGQNPDYIFPGQELVISRFSKKELVEIYKHFRRQS